MRWTRGAGIDHPHPATRSRCSRARTGAGDRRRRLSDHRRAAETPYPLAPGETIHGITRERITLPGDIGGWLEGRSRFARLGLMIHVTSGFVQPGAATRQVLEMSNVSGRTLLIHAGVRLLQIVLQRCEGNAVYQGRFARQDKL